MKNNFFLFSLAVISITCTMSQKIMGMKRDESFQQQPNISELITAEQQEKEFLDASFENYCALPSVRGPRRLLGKLKLPPHLYEKKIRLTYHKTKTNTPHNYNSKQPFFCSLTREARRDGYFIKKISVPENQIRNARQLDIDELQTPREKAFNGPIFPNIYGKKSTILFLSAHNPLITQ